VRRRWPTSRDCYYCYDCATTYTVVGNTFFGNRLNGEPLTSLPLHEPFPHRRIGQYFYKERAKYPG
jgi:hypothetical protein